MLSRTCKNATSRTFWEVLLQMAILFPAGSRLFVTYLSFPCETSAVHRNPVNLFDWVNRFDDQIFRTANQQSLEDCYEASFTFIKTIRVFASWSPKDCFMACTNHFLELSQAVDHHVDTPNGRYCLARLDICYKDSSATLMNACLAGNELNYCPETHCICTTSVWFASIVKPLRSRSADFRRTLVEPPEGYRTVPICHPDEVDRVLSIAINGFDIDTRPAEEPLWVSVAQVKNYKIFCDAHSVRRQSSVYKELEGVRRGEASICSCVRFDPQEELPFGKYRNHECFTSSKVRVFSSNVTVTTPEDAVKDIPPLIEYIFDESSQWIPQHYL
ncbi:hypothetical protein BCR37DRAFT_386211 [Protomyces lactucae-debilis]|uniref:Uncharacterized protein n=1 Tax=Protomyces lactucae-debilis TaxID=2754530 RepID=A0A1Y2FLH2_PROLT|nr:uncharacterized protein BCR37DRAFT_386211 [Protomyces lactucae-debilis]ORY84842.1 hypothetical protein BCR37DRAFT_386211 [Protomyces lactucae-debilis]